MTPPDIFLKALRELRIRPVRIGETTHYLAMEPEGCVVTAEGWRPAGASETLMLVRGVTEERIVDTSSSAESIVYLHTHALQYFRVRGGILTMRYQPHYTTPQGFSESNIHEVELRYVKHGTVYRSVFNSYVYTSYTPRGVYPTDLCVVRAMLSNGPLKEGG